MAVALEDVLEVLEAVIVTDKVTDTVAKSEELTLSDADVDNVSDRESVAVDDADKLPLAVPDSVNVADTETDKDAAVEGDTEALTLAEGEAVGDTELVTVVLMLDVKLPVSDAVAPDDTDGVELNEGVAETLDDRDADDVVDTDGFTDMLPDALPLDVPVEVDAMDVDSDDVALPDKDTEALTLTEKEAD